MAFHKICKNFGRPEIDLFARRVNAKCKKFISWHRDPDSIAVDAFTISWKDIYFYAFPPFSMILKCLQKIRIENASGIMIVPDWPSQPWYPLFRELLTSETLIFDAKTHILNSFCSQSQIFWNKNTLVAGILSAKHWS